MEPSLDFPLRVNVSTQAELDTVDISLRTQDLVDDNMEHFLTFIMKHIANVANHGGLCGAAVPPEASSMQVETTIQRKGSHGLTFRIKVAGLDPGAWRVICGVLVGISYYSFPMAAISITSLNKSDRPSLTESQVWELSYPLYPQPLPFELVIHEVPDATRNRLIQIQFSRALSQEEFAEVEGALLSWDELLNGGYPDEGEDPIDNASDAIEVYLVDEVTIEHPLPNYLGSEAAFDAVISMAAWFDRKVASVRSVEIA